MVAGVAAGLAAVGVGAGQRCCERVEGGLDDRGVLDGAAAADSDAAEAVVGDGEEPAQVRGPLQPVQCGLLGAGGAVGVEHLEQVVAGLAQLGGVQRRGLVEQHPLRLVPQTRVDREPVDHRDDHLGVLGRDVTGGERQQRRRTVPAQTPRGAQQPLPVPAPATRHAVR